MSQTLNICIIRPGSPPLNINLVPDHLPTEVRAAFVALAQARVDLDQAEKAFAGAQADNFHELDTAVRAARETAAKALEDFTAIGAASSTAVKDSANAAFVAAIERANAQIQGALDSLAEAGQAASLYASVRPGKAVLRTDTRAAEDSVVRKNLGMARSLLQEVRPWVPDGID